MKLTYSLIEFSALLFFAGWMGCLMSLLQNQEKAIEHFQINLLKRVSHIVFFLLGMVFVEHFVKITFSLASIDSSVFIAVTTLVTKFTFLTLGMLCAFKLKDDIQWAGMVYKYLEIDNEIMPYYIKTYLKDKKNAKQFEKEKAAFLTAHPEWQGHPWMKMNFNNIEMIPAAQ